MPLNKFQVTYISPIMIWSIALLVNFTIFPFITVELSNINLTPFLIIKTFKME